jgi:hypothetical protein
MEVFKKVLNSNLANQSLISEMDFEVTACFLYEVVM